MNNGLPNVADVIEISQQAGKKILEIYNADDFEVKLKSDNSPLTLADCAANDVILAQLKQLAPKIPYISEEVKSLDYSERRSWSRLWLIDPLDGTKEFIKRNGEFTVNIALIEDGIPVMGVVYVPVTDTTYYSVRGEGAYKIEAGGKAENLSFPKKKSDSDSIRVVASRSHLSPEVFEYIQNLELDGKQVEMINIGSSLKICLVAEGKADIYPRFGPTMEWDTAAAHAIALEAGRTITNHLTGEPLLYNKENLLNPWFLVR